MNQMIHVCKGSKRHIAIWWSEWNMLTLFHTQYPRKESLFDFLFSTASLQPKIWYLTLWIWSHLTWVTLTFLYPFIHHLSVMNTSVQEEKDTSGKEHWNQWIKQEVVRGRWSMSDKWMQFRAALWPGVDKKRLGDPQPLGSNSHCKKNKIHLSESWIIEILAYSL